MTDHDRLVEICLSRSIDRQRPKFGRLIVSNGVRRLYDNADDDGREGGAQRAGWGTSGRDAGGTLQVVVCGMGGERACRRPCWLYQLAPRTRAVDVS